MHDLELIPWSSPTPPGKEHVARELRREGYRPFPWSDGAGTVYAPHQHEHDECLWMVSGEMEFTVDERSYRLTPGDRLVLPRRTVHSARVLGERVAEYVIGQR